MDGKVLYSQPMGFDIRRPDVAESLERWAAHHAAPSRTAGAFGRAGAASPEADALFKSGLSLYREGNPTEAVAQWREALKLAPDSIIIHRHIWAVENPERFYDGDIDQEWKRRQTAQGR